MFRSHPNPLDRLWAARLVGAGGLAILAQFAIDMPAGYFGPAEQMTTFGSVYTFIVTALVAGGSTAYLLSRKWAGDIVPILIAVNVGVFLPPVLSDPIVAGVLVTWHLLLLGQWLFPSEPVWSRRQIPVADPFKEWLALNGPATRHLLTTSLIATTAVVGYRIAADAAAQVVCFLLAVIVLAISSPMLVLLLKKRRRGPLLGLVFLLGALGSHDRPAAVLSFLAGYEAIMLALVVKETPVFSDLLDYFYRKPVLMVLVSFIVVIAFGTLFLSFPASSASPSRVSAVDALFTATSATCVTGLIVLDTGSDFSRFGQTVILFLIQVGGINIMVLSAFGSLLLLGRGLGLRGERALGETLDLPQIGSAHRLVRTIVSSTLVLEAFGAIYLSYVYYRDGMDKLQAVWHGLFHAVSAFCNAGFALHADSFVRFQRRPAVLLVVSVLIILGGLGFVVISSFWARIVHRRRGRSTVHVRIVVAASLALIVAGTIGYAGLEWNHTLGGLSLTGKIVNAIFQSVTPRTAGFNTVDLQDLQPATMLLLLVFMFIGASPGGTGGGIKTTTAVVLLGAIAAIAGSEPRVAVFRRSLPLETIYRSAAIAVTSMLILIVGLGALLATHDLPFSNLLFEVVSALGTVGLTLGATAQMNVFGKVLLSVIMLLGRIGPLTLALLLARQSRARVRYPEAKIMIG